MYFTVLLCYCCYRLFCVTRSSPDGVTSHPIHVTVRDRRDRIPDFQSFNIVGTSEQKHLFFSYEHPNVTSVSPRRAFRTGDTLVTLTGSHLNVGSKLEVTIAGIPCAVSGYDINIAKFIESLDLNNVLTLNGIKIVQSKT